MFGRQPSDNAAQSQASAAAAPPMAPMAPQPQMTGVPAPQPLRNPDDLLRRAEWERLADADRAALLRPFQGRPVPQFGDIASEASTHADLRLQDWVAQLVAMSFQPQTAAYIRAWLSDGSPDGHLYVGGFSGQGRTSLVASVARQAMARAPIPVEYCYVPDLASLDKPMVLAVPYDTGAEFTNALRTGLRLLLANWGGDGESDSSDNSDNSSDGSDSGASNDGSDASASSANGASASAPTSQPASQPANASSDPEPDPATLAQMRGSLVDKILDIVASVAPRDGARACAGKL